MRPYIQAKRICKKNFGSLAKINTIQYQTYRGCVAKICHWIDFITLIIVKNVKNTIKDFDYGVIAEKYEKIKSHYV